MSDYPVAYRPGAGQYGNLGEPQRLSKTAVPDNVGQVPMLQFEFPHTGRSIQGTNEGIMQLMEAEMLRLVREEIERQSRVRPSGLDPNFGKVPYPSKTWRLARKLAPRFIRGFARLHPWARIAVNAYDLLTFMQEVQVPDPAYQPGVGEIPWNFDGSWEQQGPFAPYYPAAGLVGTPEGGVVVAEGIVATGPYEVELDEVVTPLHQMPRTREPKTFFEPYDHEDISPTIRLRGVDCYIPLGFGDVPVWTGPTVPELVPGTIVIPRRETMPGIEQEVPWTEVPYLIPNPLLDPDFQREVGPQPWEEVAPQPKPWARPVYPPIVFDFPVPAPVTFVPGTSRHPKPGTDPGTTPAPGPKPGTRPGIPPDIGLDLPPKTRVKERKARAVNQIWSLLIHIGPITEGFEALAAVHKALPPECQTGTYKLHGKGGKVFYKKRRKPTPLQMSNDLYKCWDKLDINKALWELFKEQMTDLVYGKTGQAIKKQQKPSLDRLGRVHGFTTGPAF